MNYIKLLEKRNKKVNKKFLQNFKNKCRRKKQK